MEGLLEALYVSDNCNLDGAERFFDNVFKPFFDEFVTFEMVVRRAADAVLEVLNRLGCRQYSSVHGIQNGMHWCKSKSSLLRFHHICSNVQVVWHGNTLCEAKDANFDVAMKKTSERCWQILTERPRLLKDACNCVTMQPAEGTGGSHKMK